MHYINIVLDKYVINKSISALEYISCKTAYINNKMFTHKGSKMS